MKTRRSALSLAAVLAATTLTGGAALLGLTRAAPPPRLAQPLVVQAQQQVPAPQEEGD